MDSGNQQTDETDFKQGEEYNEIENDSSWRFLKQLAPAGGAFVGAYLGNKQATGVLSINGTVNVNNSQSGSLVPEKTSNNKPQ